MARQTRFCTVSELRTNPKPYLDLVEKGEVVTIIRHGRPIAVLTPAVAMAWRTSRLAKYPPNK